MFDRRLFFKRVIAESELDGSEKKPIEPQKLPKRNTLKKNVPIDNKQIIEKKPEKKSPRLIDYGGLGWLTEYQYRKYSKIERQLLDPNIKTVEVSKQDLDILLKMPIARRLIIEIYKKVPTVSIDELLDVVLPLIKNKQDIITMLVEMAAMPNAPIDKLTDIFLNNDPESYYIKYFIEKIPHAPIDKLTDAFLNKKPTTYDIIQFIVYIPTAPIDKIVDAFIKAKPTEFELIEFITRVPNAPIVKLFDIYVDLVDLDSAFYARPFNFNNADIYLKKIDRKNPIWNKIVNKFIACDACNEFSSCRLCSFINNYRIPITDDLINKLLDFYKSKPIRSHELINLYNIPGSEKQINFLLKKRKNTNFNLINFFYELEPIVKKKEDVLTCMVLNSLSGGMLRLLDIYKKISNKTFTQIYYEAIYNHQFTFYKACENIYASVLTDEAWLLAEEAAKISSQTNHYLKYCQRLARINKFQHNQNIEYKVIKALFLNTSIDLNQNYISHFFTIYAYLQKGNIQQSVQTAQSIMEEKGASGEYVNITQFLDNIDKFKHIIDYLTNMTSVTMTTEMLDLLKVLDTQVSKIQKIDMIVKLIDIAKPKNKELFDLNLKINDFEFSVLNYLDSYAFDVGADTGCCQRFNGFGEAAAIDSFINPLASVLIVRYKGHLLTQSYFHYVPEDKSYVLDNIEHNSVNVWKLGFNEDKLANIYALWADIIKNKYPNIKYIKLGLAHTKINEHMFEQISESNDPRHFEYKKIYTDYKPNKHVDLLKPKGPIKKIR
ncbi:MAG: hypothetical protein WC758_08655 [Candidatus Woesearchaeota archaeon]|jgi:hypothetical protein